MRSDGANGRIEKNRKATTVETGRAGEELAADFLMKSGYRIIRLNWRCRQGEIDIIAEHQDVIVFIEVKSRGRSDHGRPVEAVTWRKQTRIAAAAALFAVSNRMSDRAMRFDIIEIIGPSGGDPRFKHLTNAFSPPGRYQVL